MSLVLAEKSNALVLRNFRRCRSTVGTRATTWIALATLKPHIIHCRRYMSCTTVNAALSDTFLSTPLGQNGQHLLKGLDVYSVQASDDNHPLAVYGINSKDDPLDNKLLPILLLHGRTWSSVPVYHLHLGGVTGGDESRSLMEALLERGLQPYAMDFRGFGGTPYGKDQPYVEPHRCVEDAETVLRWIAKRHGVTERDALPALMGWSQGALVAQLVAQKSCNLMSKLILYGSLYDPLVRYPREPLYVGMAVKTKALKEVNKPVENQFDDALEDFTIEGTIPPEPAQAFAEAALTSDPIKAQWKCMYQFNNCDPARLGHCPTLVIAGDQDPYAPLHVQHELFANLGRGSDRTWSILADSDHAVHLLEGRHRMINIVSSFIHNGKRSEQTKYI
jgi:pimeloyl-ACP methyl ester carboxylesterase